MLPSTGYFKGLNCPFYDSGLCERPYCHFRHVKKDAHSLVGEGIENGTILQQLVSEAVKKVLQQSESSGASALQIINEAGAKEITPASLGKATYNPTPIAELKKIGQDDAEQSEENNEHKRRHIPVPYTPRKPPSLPVARSLETNVEYSPFVFNSRTAQYSPGSKETPKLDPYTPHGTVESKEKYVPGSDVVLQEYEPGDIKNSNSVGYNPSNSKSNKKKLLEYEPIKVGAKNTSVVYQPTPRYLAPCFSSDEDEPEIKKKKLSTDLNDFDDLGAEFDMLGEILDEEKSKESIALLSLESDTKVVIKEKKSSSLHRNNKRNDKKENKQKHDKSKSLGSRSSGDSKISDKKENNDKHDKSKSSNSSNSRESKKSDKVSHKSSSKDKHRDKSDKSRKDRESDKNSKDRESDKNNKDKESEKKKSSSSRNSEKSSQSKDNHSSKHSSSKSKDERKKHKEADKQTSSEKSTTKSDKDKHKHAKHRDKPSVHENSLSDADIAEELDNNDPEELIEDLSESDEESIALECKRIFEEYVPEAKPNPTSDEQPANEESYEYIPTKKRISHTADKDIKVIAKAPIKPDFKVSAAQKMAERMAKVKEYHAAKLAQNAISNPLKPEAPTTSLPHPNGKIRISHVPYASTLLNAKKNITFKSDNTASQPSTSSTISQTVKKGVQRVAHMPCEKFIDRPGVLEPLASKIPANIRSTYLNMMIDECLKIYLSPTDAYARAQHEELSTSKKCKAVPIYKNSAVLAVSRLRKELQECKGVKKSGSDCSQLQKLPVSGAWSIQNKNNKNYENPNEYRGSQLYENIKKWVLTEEQLQENGFPRPHPSGDRGRAMIYAERKQKQPQGFYRTCCRCNKEYTVDKKGFPSVKEECVYHPNRKYRYRGEVKYQCCSQDGMSDGCCVASCHVYEYVDYANLKGFVKTMPPDKHSDDQGVYALDCEMCYTTHGLDLTRITVINSACQVVYETLIKPFHPIIDYNTKFSGITEEQMDSVKTTLLDVQATLLTMFNSKTILIGHSLESDFKALKLIHDTVIDTSVLYPHKMGPPYKRALRNLCSEYLKKIIQNSVDGHNSAEDATACMELIHFKLKEDLKTR